MINAIVGAGIFGLPSKLHALAGPWALLAFVACGLVVASISLCFAEVASRFTQTGGPYLYARRAFGPVAGFLIGWLMWLARVTSVAAIANVMASYIAYFWPPAGAGIERTLATSAAIVVLTSINLAGVRQSAGTATAFTIGKLAALALFAGVGVFFINPHRFAAATLPAAGPMSQVVLQLIFAFGGFEGAVVLGGESQAPRRDMPFALFVSIAAVTALYVLIQTVCIGTLPSLATSTKPLADASVLFMGATGAAVITVGALISSSGTMFSNLLVGPRVLYAMAEQHQLPRMLLRTHLRTHTPNLAILFTGLIALAFAASGTFAYLASLSVISLADHLATACALFAFRRREAELPALYRVLAERWSRRWRLRLVYGC
jgi:amino acid transporter